MLGFYYRASTWDKRLHFAKTYPQKVLMTEGYSVFTTLTYTGLPWNYWRGMANYHLGNRTIAINQFDMAYEHNPTNVHVLNAKGVSLIHQGRKFESGKYLKEAVRICPEFKEAQNNLLDWEKQQRKIDILIDYIKRYGT